MGTEFGKVLLVSLLALVIVGGKIHIHDKDCGFDPETGNGCIYEITANPLYDNGNEGNQGH